MSDTVTYDESNIKTLKDAAHIRQNPGMYVGNTDTEGLHHLVYEIVYNSVDEALVGYCKHITIRLNVDGSCTVVDDGRGIPVQTKADTGRSTLEEALTVAGTSGKFDNAAYRVSAGLHGMGAKAMNALSEWCEAEVRRDGRVWKMEFERGYATGPLQNLGPAPAGVTGTSISFKPDAEMFGTHQFDFDKLASRFRQIAYLNKGLTIGITDEKENRSETFYSEKGIAEYVVFLNEGEQALHEPIYMSKDVVYHVNNEPRTVLVEVCIQYNNGENRIEQCFTNNAYNSDGGTHLSGFRGGLTRSISAYGKKEGHFKDKDKKSDIELRGDDFREGLTAVISIGHPDPSFESQTKVKLTNPEVEGLVGSVVYEMLLEFLEKNPKDGTKICKKVLLAAEARLAAKKARDAVIDRKKLLGGGGLPGKLMDCSTKNREESELFLVEGDSAGGSAESGRDRIFQAVLPLRGKVLNVEKARLEKLLKNAEIASLIAAIGVDIDNSEEVEKVRYGKIVILTDADVDGQHIRTLLLTFFFRQMRKLIENGNIYVARPPLFKVVQKKETRFVQTREEMTLELMDRGLKDTELIVSANDEGVQFDAVKTFTGDPLRKLLPVLDEIEAAAGTLERRGHPLPSFLNRRNEAGVLPGFHVRLGVKDHFFTSQAEVEAFRLAESQKLGRELVLSDAMPTGATAAPIDPNAKPNDDVRFTVDEWHEVKTLNKALTKLKEAGFDAKALIPLPRVAGREPLVRFQLTSGDSRRDVTTLRDLVGMVRDIGTKGIQVTRFKGLGEMDAEELWDTTLDPARRTMQKVTLNDAHRAETRFRMLMGDEVEGRRDFILKHRITSTDDIDYGA
ncbi:DNA gyrase subunit B [soil metagenome]